MHVAYWGFRDDAGLFPLAHHYVLLTPAMAELEAATPHTDPVPPAVADGWRRLDERYPGGRAHGFARSRPIRGRWSPPCRRARRRSFTATGSSATSAATGSRTILLDWDRTGEGAAARRPGLVPGGQLRPAAGDQGGHHRRVPSGARVRRHRDVGRGGTSSSPPHWPARSCNWAGRRPGTRASSDGGANASPHGIRDHRSKQRLPGRGGRMGSWPGGAVRQAGVGRHRRRRGPARGASWCSTSAPGPERCAVRSGRLVRSPSPSTRRGTCSASSARRPRCRPWSATCVRCPFARRPRSTRLSAASRSRTSTRRSTRWREMRRVVRPRGRVIAAVFGEAPDGASKDAVDEVARDFGFQPPAWYVELKTRTEPRSNTPALLAARAEVRRARRHRHRRRDRGLRARHPRSRSPRIAPAWRTSRPSSIRCRPAQRSSSSSAPSPQSANAVKPCGRASWCSRVRVPA